MKYIYSRLLYTVLTDVELTPVDMLVESGSDLAVNCTLVGDLHSAGVNASMLDVSLSPSENQMRTVLDERTLSVVFRSLCRSMSHQHVFCQLPGSTIFTQSSVIVAGLMKTLYWKIVVNFLLPSLYNVFCLTVLLLLVCEC